MKHFSTRHYYNCVMLKLLPTFTLNDRLFLKVDKNRQQISCNTKIKK